MTKFEKIREIVREYQKKADGIFAEYAEKKRIAREKYSEDGFKAEFMVYTYPKYAGLARSDAKWARDKAMDVFKEIEKEFKEWMIKPVDPAILQTLDYIRNFELQLSMKELQIIEKGISGSYFGTKIFAAIARSNGFQVETVRADDFIDNLELAKSAVEMAIIPYAGHGEDGFPGRDLIEHNIINSVDYGEFPVWRLAIASEFCTRADNSFANAEKLWLETKAPVKYALTQDEQKRIRNEVDKIADEFGKVDREKADKLLEATPDILSRLDSMPDGYKYKELAQRYYALGRTGKEEEKESESMINPSVQQAAEYAKKNRKVDMDILNQY